MSIVRKGLPKGGFTKIDNLVFLVDGLSDGAKVLYGYMATLRTGADYHEDRFTEKLRIAKSTYKKRKSELVKAGLIFSERIGVNNWVLYIGSTQISAAKVKEHWDYIATTGEKGVSMNDLINRTNEENKSSSIKSIIED